MLRTFGSVLFAGLLLMGCNLDSLVSSSSQIGSTSSQALGGLVAYDLVRQRGALTDPMKNPHRKPATLTSKPNSPFNNAIPFFPYNKGEYVSSHFGWRDLWGRIDFHCGTDVAAAIGTPVKAVIAGRVTLARSAGKNGGIVIYAGGRQYTYWHVVPRRGLKNGSYVRRGQTIGRLADWGNNTHLHYGLYITGEQSSPNARLDTNCVDPMALAAKGLF